MGDTGQPIKIPTPIFDPLNPNAILYLWNEANSNAEFAAGVNKVTTQATVCASLSDVFSGGMIDDLIAPNQVLMTASRFWELSYAMCDAAGGSFLYDEFSYYVT